jgi:hypothetical protein
MRKTKTDLSSASFMLAGKTGNEEAPPLPPRQIACVICGSPVSLENCKFNEEGKPVHEDCYFKSLSGARHSRESRPKSKN